MGRTNVEWLWIVAEFLSRWVPFVPNLSFEIVRPPTAVPFTITDEMVHHVLDVFPQFSPETIRQDLIRTRSPERTIERILNGRLQEQPMTMEGDVLDGGMQADLGDDDLQWDLSMLWEAVWGPAPREEPRRPNSPQRRPLGPPPVVHGQPHEQAPNRFN